MQLNVYWVRKSITMWPAFIIQKKVRFLCLFINAAVSPPLSQYKAVRFAELNSWRSDHLYWPQFSTHLQQCQQNTVVWRQCHTLVTESNVVFRFCGCLKHSWLFLSKDYWLVNPMAQVPKKSAGTPKNVRSLLYIPEWFQKKVTPIWHWSQLWWFNANEDTHCSKTSFAQIFTYFNFWTHASVPVVQQIRSSCKTKNILLRHEAIAFNEKLLIKYNRQPSTT